MSEALQIMMKSLTRRVNAENRTKRTGDVRIGPIHEFYEVNHVGELEGAGDLFSVSEFMTDGRRDYLVRGSKKEFVPGMVRSMTFVKGNGRFTPVSFYERKLGREKMSTNINALKGSDSGTELVPDVLAELESIARSWLSTINAIRI